MTKHDRKTADELILDNAPDSATHYSWETYCKANKDFFYDWDGEYWRAYFVPDGDMRSLADIKALVAKDKRIAELEESLRTVAQTRCVSYEDLAIRDLEQQAKGIEDLAESMLFRGCLENTLDRSEVLEKAKQLREQAKQLKG